MLKITFCLQNCLPFQNISGVPFTLRGQDTLDVFSAIFYRGDNFCDFLFTSVYAKSFLKRSLL